MPLKAASCVRVAGFVDVSACLMKPMPASVTSQRVVVFGPTSVSLPPRPSSRPASFPRLPNVNVSPPVPPFRFSIPPKLTPAAMPPPSSVI